MGWRLGEIRPVNKQSGARPILDEQNSIVALVLLGSSRNESNVEAILTAPLVRSACIEAIESLGEGHPVSHRLRRALGLKFCRKVIDETPAWGGTSSSSSTTMPTTA